MQYPPTPTSANQPSLRAADLDQYHFFTRSISLSAIDSKELSPRIKLSRSTTASELLAAFSPVKHPSRPPSLMFTETMATVNASRDLRQKERVSYTISDDSDSEASPSVVSSSFHTPQKRPTRKMIDLEEDSVEELETPKSPPPRISSAGHKLRPHKELHLSLRAQENGDKPVIKKRKLTLVRKADHKKTKLILESDAKHGDDVTTDLPMAPIRTARNEIRDFIATETAAKRSTFFIAKKNYFLPLLPESNHISRLVEKGECSEADMSNDKDSTVPYETIDVQPKG